MTIGERIKHYRKNAGLSQEELAQKLFVSRQTISLWEIDKTMPTIENLILLKDIFGVSIDEILTGSKYDNTNENKEEEIKEEHTYSDKSGVNESDSKQKESLGAFLIKLIGIVLVCLISIAALCIIFGYNDYIEQKKEEATSPPTPDDQFIFLGQEKDLPSSLHESFELTFDAHKDGYYIITTTRASVYYLTVNGTKNDADPISSEGDTKTYEVYLRQGDTCILYGVTLHFSGASIIVEEKNP